MSSRWQRRFVRAVTAALLGSSAFAGPAAAKRPLADASAYCSSIPIVEVAPEEWGFHAGQPRPGANTSYARGHGTIDLAAQSASGVICQADRRPNAPERQIVLSIDHHVIFTSHRAVMFGVPGNIMRIHVHVKSSTDAQCPAGSRGEVTIFASYNGVHADGVGVRFAAGCSDQTRRYVGGSVVTNVPPN
jgi:hypothetical protein